MLVNDAKKLFGKKYNLFGIYLEYSKQIFQIIFSTNDIKKA